MVHSVLELMAMCLSVLGLIGASVTTGLPTWRVTAFIGENIIVMETRWEGLWMNCFQQANIRMQCKVYDSLLYLPPDLQAARGLMCCSVALASLGILVALMGMSCVTWSQDDRQVKSTALVIAGTIFCLASICVFVPVSWTGHVIIQDFYNPLLMDAQRRELGDALYVGWVTGSFLLASGLVFVCRRMSRESPSRSVLRQQVPGLIRYQHTPHGLTLTGYQSFPSESTRADTQPVAFSHTYPTGETSPHGPGQLRHHSSFHRGRSSHRQPFRDSICLIRSSPAAHEARFVGWQLSPDSSSHSNSPGEVQQLSAPFTSALITPLSFAPVEPQSVLHCSMFQPLTQDSIFLRYNASVQPQPLTISSSEGCV